MTTTGEVVTAEIIAALTGPRAPGQYAQAGEAGAGTPIGEVEELAGMVTATRVDGTEVELIAGMQVFQGDVIQTGPEGKVALLFADGTTFSLSPAARMVLDELVYDPGADSGSFLLSVVRGAFVFITGKIAGTGPGAMEVTTPAGFLGIRFLVPDTPLIGTARADALVGTRPTWCSISTPSEGDLLDLSGLLEELGAANGDPSAFVNLERSPDGRSIDVQVDLEGLGGAGASGFQWLVRLLGKGDVADAATAPDLPA